jgi:hypothetical protein
VSFASVVAGIKYRPGWALTYTAPNHAYGEPGWLVVQATVMCAYDNTRTIPLTSRLAVPPYMSDLEEAGQLAFCRDALRRVEYHELGEFFQYKGTRPYDPHN